MRGRWDGKSLARCGHHGIQTNAAVIDMENENLYKKNRTLEANMRDQNPRIVGFFPRKIDGTWIDDCWRKRTHSHSTEAHSTQSTRKTKWKTFFRKKPTTTAKTHTYIIQHCMRRGRERESERGKQKNLKRSNGEAKKKGENEIRSNRRA